MSLAVIRPIAISVPVPMIRPNVVSGIGNDRQRREILLRPAMIERRAVGSMLRRWRGREVLLRLAVFERPMRGDRVSVSPWMTLAPLAAPARLVVTHVVWDDYVGGGCRDIAGVVVGGHGDPVEAAVVVPAEAAGLKVDDESVSAVNVHVRGAFGLDPVVFIVDMVGHMADGA